MTYVRAFILVCILTVPAFAASICCVPVPVNNPHEGTDTFTYSVITPSTLNALPSVIPDMPLWQWLESTYHAPDRIEHPEPEPLPYCPPDIPVTPYTPPPVATPEPATLFLVSVPAVFLRFMRGRVLLVNRVRAFFGGDA